MKKTVAELRQRRAELIGELRAFHEGIVDGQGQNRAYSGEEIQEFERREAEVSELETRIEREEKIEGRERSLMAREAEEIRSAELTGRPVRSLREIARETGNAIQGWVRARRGRDLRDEHVAAMEARGIKPEHDEIDLRVCDSEELELIPRQIQRMRPVPVEQRMSTASTEGAELIPEGFVNRWEIALLAISQMRNFVTVLRTASGNALPIPTTNDTSNTGELLAEEGGAASQDVATGSVILEAYKYSSKIVKVSAELMQDAAFNLATMLGRLLGTRLARITNTHFTTGTGSSQPNGIVTAATSAFTMASASAIDPDEVMRLPYEIDDEYMSDPSCAWMMNRAIVKQIRLLRDDSGGAGTGQYLWQAGLAGEPDTLCGYPICLNAAMASALAVNAKIMLFGALGKYMIRDVNVIRLKHLKELYAANDQEGFLALSRHDGDLLDAGTHPVKYAQMAAS